MCCADSDPVGFSSKRGVIVTFTRVKSAVKEPVGVQDPKTGAAAPEVLGVDDRDRRIRRERRR